MLPSHRWRNSPFGHAVTTLDCYPLRKGESGLKKIIPLFTQSWILATAHTTRCSACVAPFAAAKLREIWNIHILWEYSYHRISPPFVQLVTRFSVIILYVGHLEVDCHGKGYFEASITHGILRERRIPDFWDYKCRLYYNSEMGADIPVPESHISACSHKNSHEHTVYWLKMIPVVGYWNTFYCVYIRFIGNYNTKNWLHVVSFSNYICGPEYGYYGSQPIRMSDS